MITILGPTASGKTALAAYTAFRLNGEVISADSRQVYKLMDIGTGKDIDDYVVDNQPIPVHIVDVAEAGTEYNVYKYLSDFEVAYQDILKRKKLPVFCGGTGLYLEAVLGGYNMVEVPVDPGFRNGLNSLSLEALVDKLKSYGPTHATTDIVDRQRVYRALEVADYREKYGLTAKKEPYPNKLIFGISNPRDLVRARITSRLKSRLENGMIEEVQMLIEKGVDPLQLISYGLEYKYITLYLQKQLDYETMFTLLNIAIHQFSKRQMTWFRKMEKSSFNIHWIDGGLSLENKFNEIEKMLNKIE